MCTETVDFTVDNSIGSLLGFSKQKLEPNKWHESNNEVNIQPVSVIRITCDIVQGSYINGEPSHIIHEFVPSVAPGFRYIEAPINVIYFPIQKSYISSLNIKVIDDNDNCINFRQENIHLRLHLRPSR